MLVALSRLLDFPAIPDDPSIDLLDSAETKFFSYSLGGFIDQASLWRIDADEETIKRAIAELELERTNAIPNEFWRVLPYYWPKRSFNC